MKNKTEILKQLKGGLIVSCQALEDEPLYSSFIMGRMAKAAKEGGAVGIRANSPLDIIEIKKTVDLPVIGLYKQVYENSDVYITSTMKEVDALMDVKPDIIALDATGRLRPGQVTLDNFFKEVKAKYPQMLFMADCATLADGIKAQEMGFDFVGTTMCGYTKETTGTAIPNFSLIRDLTTQLEIPVIAEGGIWEVSDLKEVFHNHAYAAVIGTAITRPRDITKRFVEAIS